MQRILHFSFFFFQNQQVHNKGVGRNFSRGGNGKKDQKIAKKRPKNSTFKPLFTIFVPCMKIQPPCCRRPWFTTFSKFNNFRFLSSFRANECYFSRWYEFVTSCQIGFQRLCKTSFLLMSVALPRKITFSLFVCNLKSLLLLTAYHRKTDKRFW